MGLFNDNDMKALEEQKVLSKQHTILIVDDEVSNLVTLQDLLIDDYDVLTASGGKEALELIKTHTNPSSIHVIISDQRMPEMTGVQFFEAILEEYPDTICMILTGYSDVDPVIRAINIGRVYRYITKPWNEKELKIIIDRALEAFDLEMRNRGLLSEYRWFV